jgi:hypothetical protein
LETPDWRARRLAISGFLMPIPYYQGQSYSFDQKAC